MDALDFDFHQQVKLRLEAEDPWVRDYFSSEYGFAATTQASNASTVNLKFRSSWLPAPPGKGFRFRSHKLLARWFYQIQFGPEEIMIEAAGNRTAVPMIQHMLVHPSLRCLSSERGTLLLHGAAISRSGRSLIVTGAGGAGKTTTSSLALSTKSADWSIQADDYTFVDPQGRTFAYPTRAHLYQNILSFLPDLSHRLAPRERLHLKVFGLLRRLSGERIKWPLRMGLERLWPNRRVEPIAELAGVLMLERANDGELSVERATDLQSMVDLLVRINFDEARYYLSLVRRCLPAEAYASWHSSWVQRERSLVEGVLRAAPLYRLILPRNASSGQGLKRRLATELNSLLSNTGE